MGENKPYVMDMKAGKYAWCTCGLSSKEPFCDGSHEKAGMQPMFVELEEDRRVAWCGCKVTANKPFCDGSHKKYQE